MSERLYTTGPRTGQAKNQKKHEAELTRRLALLMAGQLDGWQSDEGEGLRVALVRPPKDWRPQGDDAVIDSPPTCTVLAVSEALDHPAGVNGMAWQWNSLILSQAEWPNVWCVELRQGEPPSAGDELCRNAVFDRC